MATVSRQEKYYLPLTEDPQITGASHPRPVQPCRASHALSSARGCVCVCKMPPIMSQGSHSPNPTGDSRALQQGPTWDPSHSPRGVKGSGQGLPCSPAAELSPGSPAAGLQSLIKTVGYPRARTTQKLSPMHLIIISKMTAASEN